MCERKRKIKTGRWSDREYERQGMSRERGGWRNKISRNLSCFPANNYMQYLISSAFHSLAPHQSRYRYLTESLRWLIPRLNFLKLHGSSIVISFFLIVRASVVASSKSVSMEDLSYTDIVHFDKAITYALMEKRYDDARMLKLQ